jgi:RNA polymerase sigma-70 factor (ECF subfamily)
VHILHNDPELVSRDPNSREEYSSAEGTAQRKQLSAKNGHTAKPAITDNNELAAAREAAQKLRRHKTDQIDRDLLEQIALERSEIAFSELYNRFYPRIYTMLRGMLRTDRHIAYAEEDAHDLLQEVFILIWDKAPAVYSVEIKTAAWINQVARNRAIDELRSHKRKKNCITHVERDPNKPGIDPLDTQVEDSRTPDRDMARKEARKEIRRALRQLTPDQRCIIDLIYFAGLRYSDVAEQLNMPSGTVKTSVRQSVIKLRRVIKPRM